MFTPTAAADKTLTLDQINKGIDELSSEDRDNVTDGHHTFDALYEYRCAYNAAMFNLLAREPRFKVQKSFKHSDGKPCFDKDDMFIVQATLPQGQISNHYHKDSWDLFCCEEKEQADEWDGHTPEVALKRLREFCESFAKIK